MMNTIAILLIPVLALLAGPACYADAEHPPGKGLWKEVSGTAIHYFDDVPGRNAITHNVTPTDTGVNMRTTESVDLFGDLEGRVLYQPHTVINYVEGTLVNLGVARELIAAAASGKMHAHVRLRGTREIVR